MCLAIPPPLGASSGHRSVWRRFSSSPLRLMSLAGAAGVLAVPFYAAVVADAGTGLGFGAGPWGGPETVATMTDAAAAAAYGAAPAVTDAATAVPRVPPPLAQLFLALFAAAPPLAFGWLLGVLPRHLGRGQPTYLGYGGAFYLWGLGLPLVWGGLLWSGAALAAGTALMALAWWLVLRTVGWLAVWAAGAQATPVRRMHQALGLGLAGLLTFPAGLAAPALYGPALALGAGAWVYGLGAAWSHHWVWRSEARPGRGAKTRGGRAPGPAATPDSVPGAAPAGEGAGGG